MPGLPLPLPTSPMQALLDALATLPLPAEAGRFFHGRGGLHPGCEHWALDWFEPVWVLTSFQAVTEDELTRVGQVLAARWAHIAPGRALNWVFQCRLEQQVQTRLMAGSVPEPHVVTEQGARYAVHVLKGQNHGLFLDMAEGRRWVRERAAAQPGLRVLNLFAYTCAFSVAALQGGAEAVVNVDMASGALSIGRRNHELNGLDKEARGRASYLAHDIFNSWAKLKRGGPYGLVILDPPSFQKGSFVATKDYARLMRRLPELLAPGGEALLCLNTPKLGTAFLKDQMRELVPALQFVQRLPNPPAFADADPERALKVLVYRGPAA